MINRFIRARTMTPLYCTSKAIHAMLAELADFEMQLSEWHSSLPMVVRFPIPMWGEVLSPLPDELCQILRARYLNAREFFYRPFVQLCVENEMTDIAQHLVEQVAAVASQGLAYSVYRIQAVAVLRHHGTWFTLRFQLTYAFILLAASRASERSDRKGAAGLAIPHAWRETVWTMLDRMSVYWEQNAGGSIRRLTGLLRNEMGDRL